MTERRRQGLRARLQAPVDIALLAAFRILFGSLMCIGVVRFVLSDWVDTLYVEPDFHFKYWGFEWVVVPPPAGVYALFGTLGVLAAMVAAGAFYRVTAPLFFLVFSYSQLMDVTNYLNHYYLVGLLALLLAILPAHRAWSVDAWRNPALRAEHVPAWMLWLLRFQIGTVYVYAGLAKLGSDWLLHAQPLNIWLTARTDMPLLGPLLALPWMPLAMAWAGFLFDTTIVLWLSLRRTRPFAYALVLLFHTMTWALFDIGLFPFIMTLSALAFFSPSWPRTALRRLGARVPMAAPGSAATMAGGPLRGATAALVLGYCALQVLLPLRAHAYGGNVLWHEQGMRLSWRVMVREKHGAVTYHVRDRDTGRTYLVSPARYLNLRQEGEMSGQPDLILQLAHHVAREFEARGMPNVEVRAEARVSLNGRRPVLLIDPNLDLSHVPDGVLPARFILPAPTDAPARLRPAPLLAGCGLSPRPRFSASCRPAPPSDSAQNRPGFAPRRTRSGLDNPLEIRGRETVHSLLARVPR